MGSRCSLLAVALVALAACEEPRPPPPAAPLPIKPPPAAAPAQPKPPPRETVTLRWKAWPDASRALRVEVARDSDHRRLELDTRPVGGREQLEMFLPRRSVSLVGILPGQSADERYANLVHQELDLTGVFIHSATRGEGHVAAPKAGEAFAHWAMSDSGLITTEIADADRATFVPILELPSQPVGVGDTWRISLGAQSMSFPGFAELEHDITGQAKVTELRSLAGGAKVAVIELERSELLKGEWRDTDEIMQRRPRPIESRSQLKGHGEFDVDAGTWRALSFTLSINSRGLGTTDIQQTVTAAPAEVPAKLRPVLLAGPRAQASAKR